MWKWSIYNHKNILKIHNLIPVRKRLINKKFCRVWFFPDFSSSCPPSWEKITRKNSLFFWHEKLLSDQLHKSWISHQVEILFFRENAINHLFILYSIFLILISCCFFKRKNQLWFYWYFCHINRQGSDFYFKTVRIDGKNDMLMIGVSSSKLVALYRVVSGLSMINHPALNDFMMLFCSTKLWWSKHLITFPFLP